MRSAGGAKYTGFYLDVKSRFVYAKLLSSKTDHYRAMREVIQDARARSGRPMRFFKTDGDGIFTGEEAEDIYEQFSIRHIQSAPGDSASNDLAERTIRTLAEMARTNLLHAGAPTNLWGEAMVMVAFVWNNVAIMPGEEKGVFLSHRNILEGNTRPYDLTLLRAFGTKCFYMLTISKKKGRKLAMNAKAQLGAIIGIEDNMPAYKVYSFDPRGKVLRIPFAQIITHEGHYPFRDLSKWSEEEKRLPHSFIPSAGDYRLWGSYGFTPDELQELEEMDDDLDPDRLSEGCASDEGASSDYFPSGWTSDWTSDGSDWTSAGEHGSGQNHGDNGIFVKGKGSNSDRKLPPCDEADEKHSDNAGSSTDETDLDTDSYEPVPDAGPPPLSPMPSARSRSPHLSPRPDSDDTKQSDRILREKKYVPQAPTQYHRIYVPKKPPIVPLIIKKKVPLPTFSESKDDYSRRIQNHEPTTPVKEIAEPGEVPTHPQPPPTPPYPYEPSSQSNRIRVFDPDDISLQSVLLYRTNSGPIVDTRTPHAKIVPTDPSTKPISIPPPKNRKEALVSPWWEGYHAAEFVEMESHKKNGTWKLCPRSDVPPGTPVLRDRWAYDDKLSAGGKSYERFKARLTAMGCFQKEGVDYFDTYASPLAHFVC